jgi:ABC-type Fe3+/spermidine/putrescine transport system ATPase subunit
VREGLTTTAGVFHSEEQASVAVFQIDRSVKLSEVEDTDAMRNSVLGALEQIGIKAIYTSDKRITRSTIPRTRRVRRVTSSARLQRELTETERSPEVESLENTLYQLREWATTRTLNSSAQGEDDVNTVYTSMIRRLGDLGATEPKGADELINTMEALETRSQSFVQLGLAQPFKAVDFILPLVDLRGSAQISAVSILSPYIASQVARLDALEEVRFELTEYLDIRGHFLRGKKVHFNVRRGLTIVADGTDEALSAEMLSSGESQLLSIFTAILMATDGANLILIDEPEISLNVDWQRNILNALLEMTQRSSIQFILATHSIELLTRYNDRVLDLINR